jgi:osmotically-inducible protein OsmY
MDKQKWAPVALVDVTVKSGIVDLWGTILDEREREALKVLAQNVPGVNEVRDHMIWVEPTSGFTSGPDDSDPKLAGKKG